MKQLSLLVAILALSAHALHAQTQTIGRADPALVADKIEEYLQAHHDLGQFGGTALVAEEGKVVYEGAFGLANADWGISNNVDTKYRLASVTKQFTAMLVLQLVDEGQIDLDSAITEYLPSYPAESGDKVTIHHLLNHTSGIPSYTDRPGYFSVDVLKDIPVEDFVAQFCSEPLDFEPGTAFYYNNSGYYLLGAIVEAVTGKTYRAVLRSRIFDPLARIIHEPRGKTPRIGSCWHFADTCPRRRPCKVV
ncbi:MAG: CubicO group peptidase (beta-lactamase class C family), partial [Planctomycetota bacterium]